MHTYLVPGYGIPKNIAADDNYRRYLGIVCNTIYAESADNSESITVIFSGGPTDMFKPYRRTEAGEMARMFEDLARRPACRSKTRGWRFFRETNSLSSLENLVLSRELLKKLRLQPKTVTIFCEATRAPRIRRAVRKVFRGKKPHVMAIDFDLSANRYLDPSFIRCKERAAAKLERWAMRDPENMKNYRRAFADRIRFLRGQGPERHVEAVREWWERRLRDLGE